MILLFDRVIHQGVPAFAITLFFTKLISYTFLDWLPYYIKYTRTRSISCFVLEWVFIQLTGFVCAMQPLTVCISAQHRQHTSPLSSTWAAL